MPLRPLSSICHKFCVDLPESGGCELCRGPLCDVARPLRALVDLGDPLERLLRTVRFEDVALHANKTKRKWSKRMSVSLGWAWCTKKARIKRAQQHPTPLHGNKKKDETYIHTWFAGLLGDAYFTTHTPMVSPLARSALSKTTRTHKRHFFAHRDGHTPCTHPPEGGLPGAGTLKGERTPRTTGCHPWNSRPARGT